MIKYNLKCDGNHEFDSWFSSSSEYENLKKKKILSCIYCSSKKISKTIMAPMISSNKDLENDLRKQQLKLSDKKEKLIQMRNFIENNFEYVGKDFSKKVREIYYDNDSKKGIYGTTTHEEREELSEEGIDLFTVPWLNKDN